MSFYCVNPDVVKREQEYYKNAKIRYEDFKKESIDNKNKSQYEIIVINNSKSAKGILDFIENISNYVDKHVKIYLYKKDTGIEYFLGPIYIDSVETSHIISYIINNFNKMDDYVVYPKQIEIHIKEYFNSLEDKNAIDLFF